MKNSEEIENHYENAVTSVISGNNSSIIKIRGTTQGTVLEYAAGNSFRKIKEHDTVKDVIEKLFEVIARLKNDYSIFDETDTVINCYWGDLLEVIRQLFEGNVSWMKQFEITAMAVSDELDLFSPHCQTSVTVGNLKDWMQKMWQARSSQTRTKKMANLMSERNQETSDDLVMQFDESLRMVKRHLGVTTELLLPGKLKEDQEVTQPVLVDVTHLLAILKTIELWTNKDLRLWDKIKKEDMDKITFPNSLTDGSKPPKTSTLLTGLQSVQEGLRIELANQHSTSKSKAVYTFTTEEEKVKEEDVGDDFMEEEFDQYQESVFRGLNAVSDLAVKLNRKQMRVLRVRNKKIFQRDSEKHKCGRGGCTNYATHLERRSRSPGRHCTYPGHAPTEETPTNI